jgi:hypothetical protein
MMCFSRTVSVAFGGGSKGEPGEGEEFLRGAYDLKPADEDVVRRIGWLREVGRMEGVADLHGGSNLRSIRGTRCIVGSAERVLVVVLGQAEQNASNRTNTGKHWQTAAIGTPLVPLTHGFPTYSSHWSHLLPRITPPDDDLPACLKPDLRPDLSTTPSGSYTLPQCPNYQLAHSPSSKSSTASTSSSKTLSHRQSSRISSTRRPSQAQNQIS